MTNFFSFFRKKKKKINLGILTDIHAHLIPNIDDGPKTMEESIELIEELMRLGYRKLTATPHVYNEFYPNTKTEILDKFIALKNKVDQLNLPLELSIAAEYFLDDHFIELLQKGDILPIAKQYILVELSFVAPPTRLHEYIFEIQTRDYQLILAHPERYSYMSNEDYKTLIDHGCIFQANLLSFAGYYGKFTKKRAFDLLKKGWLQALGTDAHNMEQLRFLQKMQIDPKLNKLFDQQWLNEFI